MLGNELFIKRKTDKELDGLDRAGEFEDIWLFEWLARIERLAGSFDYCKQCLRELFSNTVAPLLWECEGNRLDLPIQFITFENERGLGKHIFIRTPRSLGGGSIQEIWNMSEIRRAWQMFARGKWRQKPVQAFWPHLEENLFTLYHDLASGLYCHGPYRYFVVNDTKPRHIAVASVRDRIVHELLSAYLSRIYTPRLYAHSCAAQKGKGVSRARAYVLRCIGEHRFRDAWIGKLDVSRYFASVDQAILLSILSRRITDARMLKLCRGVIESFGTDGRGVPLGNVTSQWFGNIYLNELDWYAKQHLLIRSYMRYNDDMIIIDAREDQVRAWTAAIQTFVTESLHLSIPSSKVWITHIPDPLDILGLVTDGGSTWIRPTTARKAKKRIQKKYACFDPTLLESMCSYHGIGIPCAPLDFLM